MLRRSPDAGQPIDVRRLPAEYADGEIEEDAMKMGPRMPSLRKRLSARTSWKRYARHSLGLKAPRGMGWITNPRRAAYNRLYHAMTFDPLAARRRRQRRQTGGRGVALVVFGLIVLGMVMKAMGAG